MINQSATSECGPEAECLSIHATRLNKTEERREGRKVESARADPFVFFGFLDLINCESNEHVVPVHVTMRSSPQT